MDRSPGDVIVGSPSRGSFRPRGRRQPRWHSSPRPRFDTGDVQARRKSCRSVQEGARRGDARDGGRAGADGRLFGRSAGLRGGGDAAAAGDAAADARGGDAGAGDGGRLRAPPALPRRRHAPALCAGGRDGGGALRGDGDGALRGGGRAGDAGDGGEHRRADRRGRAADGLWRADRSGAGAAGAGGGVSGAPPRHRAGAAQGGRERHGALAGASRGPCRRDLRRDRGGARRPAGLRPLRAAGDRRSRLRRGAGRGSRRQRARGERGRGGGGEPAGGARGRRGGERARRSPRRTRPRRAAPRPQDMPAIEDADSAEMAEELEVDEGEAPERRPPPPWSEADPHYQVFVTRFDEEIAAEDLADPIELERLRAYLDQQLEPLEGGGGAAGEPAAAAAAGAAEPRLGLRPRGGDARRRAAGAGGGEPDDALELQDGAGHRLPRHGGDAPARQFRLDARAADLDRGDLGRRAGADAGALPGEGRRSSASPPGPGRAGRAARRGWRRSGRSCRGG